MKGKKLIRLFFLLFIFSGYTSAFAQELPPKPNPPKLVNDYAGVLSEEEKNLLEQKLVAFNDSTSSQIAVVLMQSTGEYPVDDYAIALYRNWGIGQKGKDNGVVILCAMADRRVAIITGYGLEGALPDAVCKRIIEQQIKPNFKQQQYFNGLNEATDVVIKRASGEYTADEVGGDEIGPAGGIVFIIGVFIFIIGLSFFIQYHRVKRYAILNSIDFWTAWQLLSAVDRRNSRSSGGSGWSSGGSGGGWSSGGGFGGFGGGSTGGGGASGSW